MLADIQLGIKDFSIFGIGSLAGGLIGWIATILKTRKEIQKLEGEITKLAGDIVRDLQGARRSYVDACASTTKAARALREAIINSPDDIALIDGLRDALCDAYSEAALPRHHDYCQWEALRLKQEPGKLFEFITDEVVYELRRFRKWLDLINSDSFLVHLQRGPLIVNRRTLRPYYELPIDLPETEKKEAERILRAECSKLIEEG